MLNPDGDASMTPLDSEGSSNGDSNTLRAPDICPRYAPISLKKNAPYFLGSVEDAVSAVWDCCQPRPEVGVEGELEFALLCATLPIANRRADTQFLRAVTHEIPPLEDTAGQSSLRALRET